jgi:hypothetical protein
MATSRPGSITGATKAQRLTCGITGACFTAVNGNGWLPDVILHGR